MIIRIAELLGWTLILAALRDHRIVFAEKAKCEKREDVFLNGFHFFFYSVITSLQRQGEIQNACTFASNESRFEAKKILSFFIR